MTPEQLALIMFYLEPDLPALVGQDAWAEMAPMWTDKLHRLRSGKEPVEQMRLAADLRTMLAPYVLARQQLNLATGGVSQYQHLLTELAEWAERNNGDPEQVRQLREAASLHTHASETRQIILHGTGKKAQSIKWANLEFDFGESTKMVVGVLAAVNDIIDPNGTYLLMAAGVLLIIRSVVKALTVEISEQDASVFWGVIQAQRHNVPGRVDTIQVIDYTNRERAKVHLTPLSEQQVRHALHNLVGLGSVAQMDGAKGIWRVIEKYRSKS